MKTTLTPTITTPKTTGILCSDLAARCGISEQMLRCLIDQGRLPGPDMYIRQREGYSEQHARTCVEIFQKTGGLLRITHLASRAKASPYYIHKLIKEDRLPSPQVNLLSSHFYLGTEVEKLVELIKTCRAEDRDRRIERNSHRPKISESANRRYEERRKRGYYSSRDVVDMSGVSCITVAHHQGVGRIPKPTHEVEGYFGYYYNRKEAKKVIEFLKERKAKRKLL